MTQTPGPGWFPDPSDPSLERLWDGSAWTNNTRPRVPQAQPPGVPSLSPALLSPGWPPTAGPAASTAGGTAPARPRTNMVWAVVSVVLFCIPLGIVGIVYASKVNSLWSTGQYDNARSASKKALVWSLSGMAIGIAAYAIAIAGVIAEGTSGTSSSSLTCSELADEAVRISADLNKGTIKPLLLRVERPQVVRDVQKSAKLPTSGEAVVLECAGKGYFSTAETATVDLTLSWDPDGKAWVAYAVQ